MSIAAQIRFTVYGRAWCHLCDDMLATLRETLGPDAGEIGWVDIDADDALSPELLARYDELVPVLTATVTTHAGNGVASEAARHTTQEICHYFLDRQALADFLGTVNA